MHEDKSPTTFHITCKNLRLFIVTSAVIILKESFEVPVYQIATARTTEDRYFIGLDICKSFYVYI